MKKLHRNGAEEKFWEANLNAAEVEASGRSQLAERRGYEGRGRSWVGRARGALLQKWMMRAALWCQAEQPCPAISACALSPPWHDSTLTGLPVLLRFSYSPWICCHQGASSGSHFSKFGTLRRFAANRKRYQACSDSLFALTQIFTSSFD